MKLNAFEKLIVSNPLRFWVQNHLEAKLLTKSFTYENKKTIKALEIGCGFGNGIGIISRVCNPGHIVAIDFDPQMVNKAIARNKNRYNLEIMVGDAASLNFEDNTFDKVFDFAVFHHIPDWQLAVQEVYRVLTPGGYFYIEDLYRNAICNPISKRLFVHPQSNRFNHIELLAYLEICGFKIKYSRHLWNLCGVILAQKLKLA